MSASARVVDALRSLRGHPEFEVVAEWLNVELQQLYRDAVAPMSSDLRQYTAGRAAELQSLIDTISKAR